MIRLATDVGGTFTDLIGYDEATGQLFQAKVLTTAHDQSEGVLGTIAAASALGLDPARIGFLAHGGTTVINAITERKGVRTALVTTAGFRDVLEIGRGNRPDLYNLRFRSPEPFVPRHLRFEVRERLDAKGGVVTPLVLEDLTDIAAACLREGVEAVGILFLHSYANPAHERAAAAALAALLPSVTVCASHEISREWREYERSNTVAMNAYVQPIIRRYFSRLEAALAAQGVDCPYYAMQSNGGIATFAQAIQRPLTLVESGPAGGVAGAARIGSELGQADVLYLDVGGTTAKCSLIRNGRPKLDTAYKMEHSRIAPGYPVQVPVVDIVEIGAGGGSIATIDARGALRVGPQSAGSQPGPACYGRGGTDPTVTDALLTIGVYDPTAFAGGTVPLDPGLARQAIARVAGPLGLTPEAAALAVLDVAVANTINALKLVTVQRGHDPRDAAFVVSGGMGPALGPRLGREMQARCTVIPPHPGIFSAWGMLAARPRADFRTTWFAPLDDSALAGAMAQFEALKADAIAHFGRGDGAKISFDLSVDARYRGQEHGVLCEVLPDDTVGSFAERFHGVHTQAYTFRLDGAPIEITGLHLEATLETETIRLVPVDPAGRGVAASRKGSRAVWLREKGWTSCAVHDRALLPVAEPMPGPLLIEEATATTLVLLGQVLTLTETGIILIREAD
jgi:N-methylhydantoinase A